MSFVDTWDVPGTFWDSGLQWDVNVGPSLGDISGWLDLVASQHKDKPKFIASLSAALQPFADIIYNANQVAAKFDLDVAAGVQLDAVGEWIGASRLLTDPIDNVYFAWDTPNLGWDQGVWWRPGLDLGSVLVLPDEQYRTLLRARAAANQWDGTIPGAYDVWDILFADTDFTINIIDHDDMTMDFQLVAAVPPDALTIALVEGNFLTLKPAGVEATATVV